MGLGRCRRPWGDLSGRWRLEGAAAAEEEEASTPVAMFSLISPFLFFLFVAHVSMHMPWWQLARQAALRRRSHFPVRLPDFLSSCRV